MNRHGELQLSWEGNILIVKAKGAFNNEGALAGVIAIKKLVSTKNLPSWHRLGFWDEEYLGSPSTLQMFKEVHEWCSENGCGRVAVVVCNSLQENVAGRIFGSKAKVFRLESDARDWLFS
jgi:hypothetical protein